MPGRIKERERHDELNYNKWKELIHAKNVRNSQTYHLKGSDHKLLMNSIGPPGLGRASALRFWEEIAKSMPGNSILAFVFKQVSTTTSGMLPQKSVYSFPDWLIIKCSYL